jgi:hypothetical protein
MTATVLNEIYSKAIQKWTHTDVPHVYFFMYILVHNSELYLYMYVVRRSN